MTSGAPLKGQYKLKHKGDRWVWQYKHGAWHNDDNDDDDAASDIVEVVYQEYLRNPFIDVRAVKSGRASNIKSTSRR